jgi:hypothetical protein
MKSAFEIKANALQKYFLKKNLQFLKSSNFTLWVVKSPIKVFFFNLNRNPL